MPKNHSLLPMGAASFLEAPQPPKGELYCWKRNSTENGNQKKIEWMAGIGKPKKPTVSVQKKKMLLQFFKEPNYPFYLWQICNK